MSCVHGRRLVGRDHVEPTRPASGGSVAVDAELEVGPDPVARAPTYVDARPPPVLPVAVPGHHHVRAQAPQARRQQP